VWLTGTVQNWCLKYVRQIIWVSWHISMLFLCRCNAQPHNLDDFTAHLRTHEKTDLLCQLFNPGIVWDEYGLWSDVVVSWTILLSDIEITVNISLAIYSWIPACQYSWANHTRSPSSTHQRGLQRPPHILGSLAGLSISLAWKCPCTCCYPRHWSQVSFSWLMWNP
jgi:hypothetical protein